MIRTYLEDLLYRLSEIVRFKIGVLNLLCFKISINAFAAPGGIIGINLGMFLNTKKKVN